MASRSSSEDEQAPHESKTSPLSVPPNDNVQSCGVSDRYSERTEKRKDETPGLGHLPQHVPSSSRPAINTDEDREMFITGIRATDVALGIRGAFAGLYIVVHHSGLEWRTENKCLTVNDDVVEWSGPIPIPSDLSATVCIEVYTSFESQPPLGAREPLRRLTVTVEQLLESFLSNVPLTPGLADEDVVSPSLTIFVTVEWPKCDSSDPSALSDLGSLCSFRNKVQAITNQSHSAVSRYPEHGGKPHLGHVIEELERALSIFLQDNPGHMGLAAAELPKDLYLNALATRPRGHVDRPSEVFQLTVDETEEASVEDVLHGAAQLSSVESHENPFILQLDAGQRVGPVLAHDQSLVGQGSAPRLTDEELSVLSCQLLECFERTSDLVHLQRAVTVLEKLVESAPPGSDFHRAGLANLGVALWYRFSRLGELSDLEEATSRNKNAVALTPNEDPHKPACLSNLGNCLKTRFERIGNLRDLEDAISTLRNAVNLTPHGHPDRPSRLNNLGNSLLTRFERLGELSDLEDAISMLRNGVDLTPHDHRNRPACLGNLGNSFLSRFECLGELGDLEEAISILGHVVALTPDGHSDKPSRLNNLGNAYFTRFERLGELKDLEEALSRYRGAVDLTHSLPHKASRLYNLGNCFKARFARLRELSDLEDAITTLRDAVSFTPSGHPDRPSRLNSLGGSLRARFEHLGHLSDLEDSISLLKKTSDLTPCGHPDMPRRLTNLGNSFSARFKHLGELSDLENAISKHKDAVHLTPDGHPNKPSRLADLGNSYFARFKRLGELSDLEDAISSYRDAVDLTPRDRPGRPGHLSNLGSCFVTRFEHLGEPSDLQNSVSMLKEAVDLTLNGHPDKPLRLDTLGNSFLVRFEHLGELRDLEDAITMFRDAVQLTPHGHLQKPRFLNNLGTCLRVRFKRLGELSDLEDAISRHRHAVDLSPDGHPHKSGRVNSLGTCLLARFQRLGELSDLEDAISMLKSAVNLAPPGHPDKPGHLNNLGNALLARFERLGELSDLEDTASTLRQAVDLIPRGHTDKPTLLNTLGNSFRARYDRLGELRDLEDAILTLKEAVDLSPHGPSHPDKPGRLHNLGNSLIARFEHLGGLSDLDDAISRHREAVNLIPHDHPHKSTCLSGLGNSLLTRFERLGELSDLEDAISSHTEATGLTARDHPDMPHRLNNLGNCLATRFDRLGDLIDLEKAISSLKDSVDLIPDGHSDKPVCLSNLGGYFFTRFEHLEELSDLEEAISLFSHAASSPVGPISIRFHASRKWISCAQRIYHHTLLQAYSLAISLLPQLAWIGLSLTHRYSELTRGTNVVREAAAAALDAGFPETAVEWLEQGRSIVWGELFQLRSSYEELSSAYPHHAHKLRDLSAALEHASTVREKSSPSLSEPTQSAVQRTMESLQQEADKHRKLAIERDRLLQEIRGLPGFERFLLQKEFSQLRASARSGPVVILNAAESRCDALVVRADIDRVVHVPLPNFTFKRSADLQNMMKKFVRHARVSRYDDREGQSVKSEGISWPSLLSPLWKCVVKPVLDALEISTPGNLSRIFWCPTGPFAFLPIHAAGFYDSGYSQPGHKVFDFAISSYVPTLSILGQSPNPTAATSSDLRLLAVRQPPSDGLPQLPGVTTELEHIKEAIRDSPSSCTTLLESTLGTVEEVLDLMKSADWVHFACHGVQDSANATNSGLCLADERRLRLRDVIALSRPHGGLAFLSACQTATGEERLPEEAVHIAAGMLFAGYGGVVGTMWSISDKLAPQVARDVYDELFRNCTRPDYREAARALHEAVSRLRESGNASFDEWLPFIHVGL